MRGRSERTSMRATSMAWRTPFPPSRMPASIELSIKLVVCLHSMPFCVNGDCACVDRKQIL